MGPVYFRPLLQCPIALHVFITMNGRPILQGSEPQLTTTFQEDGSRPNTSRSGLQEGQVTGEGGFSGVGVAVMIVDDFRFNLEIKGWLTRRHVFWFRFFLFKWSWGW